MIRKTFIFGFALMLASLALYAQDTAKKSVKVTGYLIDNMCAKGDHGDDDAATHSTACSLMPGCAKSGYTVVAADKSYKLDESGNEQAAIVLNASKTKKGLKVEVEGTIEGDTLHAERLKEVAAKK